MLRESQADNKARAYFLPEEITSFLLMRKIQINKKARLIIKPQTIFVKFKEINCLWLKKNSAALKTIPMKHMAKPRGFNPNKLYEKPSPWRQTVYKPVTEKILSSAPKAPEVLAPEERK